MDTALMVLGLLWLVNGILMFFMVEYDEDENKDEEGDNRKIEGNNYLYYTNLEKKRRTF